MKKQDTTNIYQIIVGFLNPSTASITIDGKNEKEAESKVIKELSKQFTNVKVINTVLLDTVPLGKSREIGVAVDEDSNVIQLFPDKEPA